MVNLDLDIHGNVDDDGRTKVNNTLRNEEEERVSFIIKKKTKRRRVT